MYHCQNHLAPTHFHLYFTPSTEVHGYDAIRQASGGDLFLTGKTTFQYGGQLSIQVQGFGDKLLSMLL